jgi:serine phosphatase RsbU (regulator of sigma subunit)
MSDNSADMSAGAEAAALERVTDQVLAMKQAGDLEKLVEAIWRVLQEQRFDFVSCGLSLIDRDHGRITVYSYWDKTFFESAGLQPEDARAAGEDLLLFVTHASMAETPSWMSAGIRAWRDQQIEGHVLEPKERDELIQLARTRFDTSTDVSSYPVRYHLHVPCPNGVFTLRTASSDAEPFGPAQIQLLQRLVERISVGYSRYREFRQVEHERAAQQLRAEVQGMTASRDILDVMLTLRNRLLEAGVGHDYLSVSVRDPDRECVRLYRIHADNWRNAACLFPALRKLRSTDALDLLYDELPLGAWDENRTEEAGFLRVVGDSLIPYWERMSRIWNVDKWPEYMMLPFSGMMAPFPGGRINVCQFQDATPESLVDFTPEQLDILELFAEAFGLGMARFADFQRLEQRNRELEIEDAVEQVQNAVLRMEKMQDLVTVIFLLTDQIGSLGLGYDNCTISVVDREANRVHIYSAPHETFNEDWARVTGVGPSRVSEPEALDGLGSVQGPLFVQGIPGAESRIFQYSSAPLDAYHGKIQEIRETAIISRTEAEAAALIPEYKARWGLDDFPLSLCPRSIMRSPFTNGTLALSHRSPDLYGAADAHIIERFADAFSLGYARYLDFQHLAQTNQALSDANNELFRVNRSLQQANEQLESANREIQEANSERDRAREQLVRELEEELQVAHDLQMGLMPTESPDIEGLDIAGRCLTANHVGGDCFQYFQRDGVLLVCLADVTGHAMEAAIPVVMFDGILKSQIELGDSLEQLFGRLNRTLCDTLDSRTFVCFTMAEIDLVSRRLHLANGGCPYTYHFRAASGDVAELQVDAYPLGVRANSVYASVEVSLEPGDYLVFCSDGIIEAENRSGELFGFERTADAIRNGCRQGVSSEALVQQVIAAAKGFAGETAQGDDQTIVAVRVER